MHVSQRIASLLVAILLLAGTELTRATLAGQQPAEPSVGEKAAREVESAADEGWQRLWDVGREYWQLELFKLGDEVFHLGDFARAVIVFFLVLLAASIAQVVLRRTVVRHLEEHAEKSETLLDDMALAVVRKTKGTLIVLFALCLAVLTLPLPAGPETFFQSAAMVVVTIQGAIWATAALGGVLDKEQQRRAAADPSAASAFGLLGFFSRVAVWSLAVLLALSSLGYPIGPLLAGLGVGGVAVAFALQHILGDIFCSIAIVLDKPFVLGDFIIVGDYMGTVENIGIKTTRIRSLGGEQIVFSNADLIGSRVRNYKRMFQRRIVFAFGIVYETPAEKIKKIPETVKSIIEGIEQTRFDRAHFKEFGDSSLNYEVVYYVLVPEYNAYMDIQQEINLKLFAAFEKDDVAFAYPTREIIMRPTNTA